MAVQLDRDPNRDLSPPPQVRRVEPPIIKPAAVPQNKPAAAAQAVLVNDPRRAIPLQRIPAWEMKMKELEQKQMIICLFAFIVMSAGTTVMYSIGNGIKTGAVPSPWMGRDRPMNFTECLQHYMECVVNPDYSPYGCVVLGSALAVIIGSAAFFVTACENPVRQKLQKLYAWETIAFTFSLLATCELIGRDLREHGAVNLLGVLGFISTISLLARSLINKM